MTYEDARAKLLLEYCPKCGEPLPEECAVCEIDIAIKAIEKQIPAEPHFEGDGYWNGELVYDTWVCPNCGTDYEVETDKYNYCPECGQRIDWSEEE